MNDGYLATPTETGSNACASQKHCSGTASPRCRDSTLGPWTMVHFMSLITTNPVLAMDASYKSSYETRQFESI